MKNLGTLVVIALIVGLFLVSSTMYVVTEGERAIVTRFQKVLRNSDDKIQIQEPGLHFKMPLVDQVRKLDAKLQTLDSTADRFVTSEKKDLIIDSYVKWRIEDFHKFFTSTGGNILQAEDLLKKKITNSLRSQIGKLSIKEIVSGKSEEKEANSNLNSSEEFASKRDEVMQNALNATKASAKDLGIEIIDVRMKQINLPEEVSSSIYQRMRAERNAVAKLHRSQGRQEAETIKAKADRNASVRLANAERDAKKIRAEGDAKATSIYANSYNKDASLFEFLRSMNAYKTSFDKGGNVIVTESNNDYLKYFN